MLEQRRAQEKGYITLKEAAEISNYSADYIGQLIRNGKIKGEQVYSTVAWVTTEDEIVAYLKDRSGSSQSSQADFLTRPQMQSAGRFLLYGVIGLLCVMLLFLQYILYVSFDRHLTSSHAPIQQGLAK